MVFMGTPKRKLTFNISDDHPLHYARRTADGDWQFDNHYALQYFTERKVFRLSEMYFQPTDWLAAVLAEGWGKGQKQREGNRNRE
ncbi:unnamed protein product [Enterobius vermicularis]|uniref:KTSC domain-containing protein n=1 Tax=Enterobius vermicularis TaxID=51028 RepID=A0A0N4V3K4_ENTVE|nr:unnamed protein product [Enterobius vermicularis]